MNIYRKIWCGIGLSALAAMGSAMGCADAQTEGAIDPDDEEVAEAKDALVGAQNLALGKTATQSPTGWGADAARAVDGNTNGDFGAGSVTHTTLQSHAWWQVDLGSAQPISSVVVWNRTDCCADRLANFRVRTSSDGATWTDFPYSGQPPTQTSFQVNRTAQYVRVELDGTNYLSLAEVQVFGVAQRPGKVDVLDLAGGAPGVERYKEAWGDSELLSGWLDPVDLHLAGDFRGLGHDQVLHINRDYAAGAGKLMMVDYSSGVVPGTAPYWETWGQSPMLSGWLENEDRQLAGDFMGLGHDQVMFINRNYGPGAGKLMVLDYVSGVVPGVARYWENWDQSPLLSGWLDDADRQYVGDFMGLGHAQVMFINRNYGAGAGKVMIVDYAGGTVPGAVKYWESWDQNALLSGWLEDADRQIVGDFMGLGHAQVMFINRNYGAGAGKVMIVDYAGGTVPGAVKYWESWDQSPFLGGWLDDGDLQIAGDFKGLGRDQVLYVNTQNAANGKLMAVDYAGGQVPGQAVYFESWLQPGPVDEYLTRGDTRVVGDFTGVGHAELESFNLDDTSMLAAKFAPRLRFDGAATSYPMSAQQFYDQQVLHPTSIPGIPGAYTIVQNTSYAPVANNQVPTYYQVIGCGTSQLRIKYWWFYGYQDDCTPGFGSHNGDWEDVTITLSEDRSKIAAMTYSAHGDRYTRLSIRGGIEMEEGTHPVVYPGKVAHGSYYGQGGDGTCFYWGDWHNNGDGSHMDSWNNLLSLDTGMEPWMIADRNGGFDWGPNGGSGIGTHPTQQGPICHDNACQWDWYWGFTTAPAHSQCEAGDDDTGSGCAARCNPGYSTYSTTCTNWSTLHTYTRQFYGYDWPIPITDVGLLSYAY